MKSLKVFAVGFAVLALSACSDKEKSDESQNGSIQSSVLLSEQSTKEEIVKAMIGNWGYCNNQVENGSVDTQLVFSPTSMPDVINVSKLTLSVYNQKDCQGTIVDKQEFDNSGDVKIIDYKKGSQYIEGIDDGYLDLRMEVKNASGAVAMQNQALNPDGKKLIDYGNKVMMYKQ